MPIILMKSTYYPRWNLYSKTIANVAVSGQFVKVSTAKIFIQYRCVIINGRDIVVFPRLHLVKALIAKIRLSAIRKRFRRRKIPVIRYITLEKNQAYYNNHYEWGYCCTWSTEHKLSNSELLLHIKVLLVVLQHNSSLKVVF